jgi:hypothetical protein
MLVKYELFWDIAQRQVVILYHGVCVRARARVRAFVCQVPRCLQYWVLSKFVLAGTVFVQELKSRMDVENRKWRLEYCYDLNKLVRRFFLSSRDTVPLLLILEIKPLKTCASAYCHKIPCRCRAACPDKWSQICGKSVLTDWRQRSQPKGGGE